MHENNKRVRLRSNKTDNKKRFYDAKKTWIGTFRGDRRIYNNLLKDNCKYILGYDSYTFLENLMSLSTFNDILFNNLFLNIEDVIEFQLDIDDNIKLSIYVENVSSKFRSYNYIFLDNVMCKFRSDIFEEKSYGFLHPDYKNNHSVILYHNNYYKVTIDAEVDLSKYKSNDIIVVNGIIRNLNFKNQISNKSIYAFIMEHTLIAKDNVNVLYDDILFDGVTFNIYDFNFMHMQMSNVCECKNCMFNAKNQDISNKLYGLYKRNGNKFVNILEE